jgi:hypothetical protein
MTGAMGRPPEMPKAEWAIAILVGHTSVRRVQERMGHSDLQSTMRSTTTKAPWREGAPV